MADKKEKTLKQKIGEIQFEIGRITKDKDHPHFNSKYFDINQLLEQLIPLLHEHNITVMQPLCYAKDNDRTVMKTILLDDNEELEFVTPLPNNPNPQKMGSIITYYRRYTLQSLFCLQAKDDDGDSAVDNKDKKSGDFKKNKYS